MPTNWPILGVQIGILNNAVSVDHLEEIGEEEIAALRQSKTIPTVLPFVPIFWASLLHLPER